MQITVRNNADAPKKYIRLLRWKLYNLAEKFKDLIYTEAYLSSEGNSPKEYQLKLRLGIPGHDLIISKKSMSLEEVILRIEKTAHLSLVSTKNKSLRF